MSRGPHPISHIPLGAARPWICNSLCVCVSVCVHTCVYSACVCMCPHMCVYPHMCECSQVSTRVYPHLCVYVSTRVYPAVYVSTHVYPHMCMCSHVHTCVPTLVCPCPRLFTVCMCIHTCVHTCQACVCLHMCAGAMKNQQLWGHMGLWLTRSGGCPGTWEWWGWNCSAHRVPGGLICRAWRPLLRGHWEGSSGCPAAPKQCESPQHLSTAAHGFLTKKVRSTEKRHS